MEDEGMSTDTAVDARRTDTRERIISVAAGLFAEKGFAGTSIRDISDALGVTKAALYYHFASKEEMLAAIVDAPIAAVREVLQNTTDVSTPQARRELLVAVVASMRDCQPAGMAIFRDPQLQELVGTEIAHSGIVNNLAIELAKGLSGVTEISDIQPEHLIRASAAVAAGLAVIDSWHIAYPGSDKFSEESCEYIADTAAAVLER
jgi:AcrR family transcriptional regulator